MRQPRAELVPPVTPAVEARLDTGARRLTPSEQQAESGAVDSYLVGEFEFIVPQPRGRYLRTASIRLARSSLRLSGPLAAQMPPSCGRLCVGVDRQRRLLTVVPVQETRMDGYAIRREKSGTGMSIRNSGLAAWLAEQGVPVGVDIPARWQPQTQSIVGRWP